MPNGRRNYLIALAFAASVSSFAQQGPIYKTYWGDKRFFPLDYKCRLQVIYDNNVIRGFKINEDQVNDVFPFTQPQWIEPLKQKLEVRTQSEDGVQELRVRFKVESGRMGDPDEFEYHRLKDPRRDVYCIKLEYTSEGVPAR